MQVRAMGQASARKRGSLAFRGELACFHRKDNNGYCQEPRSRRTGTSWHPAVTLISQDFRCEYRTDREPYT